MNNKIPDKYLLTFMLAGCAEFILVDDTAHKKYHYKVREKKDGTIYYVTCSGTYLGAIYPNRRFYTTRGDNANPDASRCFLNMFATLVFTGTLPEGQYVLHTGRCGVCRHKLTDPLSIETGIGPVCREKLGIRLPLK